VTLETALAGDAQSVEADPRALGRLLVNLLDNAIKHSPPGATVRVGVEFTASHFRLWVDDHGPGIPAEEHGRIFERFYRVGSELQRETPGVGLGLAIVRQVATAHGGRVLVRSAPGEGSCFTVELPRRQASMAHGDRHNGNGYLPS
jgi:signal transduction histidine kinase